MAVPTVDKAAVLAVAAELSSVLDAVWAVWLPWANEFDLSQTGATDATVTLARIYLAAHMVTMSKRGSSAAAGPLTGESAGGLRRSYGLVSMNGAGSFPLTRYGQLFLDLLDQSPAKGPFLI